MPGSESLLGHLRSGDWLDRGRVLAYARVLIVLESLALLIMALLMHGVFGLYTDPVTMDFTSFYAAGHLADIGRAAGAYDQATHWTAEEQMIGFWGFPYLRYFYPPVFMLICVPLSWLAFLPAYSLWIVATGTAYLAAVRAILRPGHLLLPFVAYGPVFLEIGVGQNAFLTAALFAGATLLVDRRPFLAGLLFGALCYKPHFGLLVPVALIAGGQWRAVAGAALSVGTLVGLTLLLFGFDAWMAFLSLGRAAQTTFQEGYVNFAGLVSPFAAVRLIGGPPWLAYVVQGGVTLAAAGIVWRVWRLKTQPLAVRAAVLIAATVVSLPVILFYDLVTLAVAIAWLARDARRTGYLPWEKLALSAVFVLPLLILGFGLRFHVPLGPVLTLTVLRFCVLRSRVPAACIAPVAAAKIPLGATA